MEALGPVECEGNGYWERGKTEIREKATKAKPVTMGEVGDMIIDSLLCFISSAKADYPKQSLKEVAYAFYSHENIKKSKTTLCNLLKKDICWRRDPDKKSKDLSDVLDYHDELVEARKKY